MKQRWLKIVVTFDAILTSDTLWRWVTGFEDVFRVKHLYFARYEDTTQNTIEISALTGAQNRSIENYFFKCVFTKEVKMDNRGSGSLAHAHAYQLIKHLSAANRDKDLCDVLHWVCNMYGLNYIRELAFYSHAITALAHCLADNGDQQLKEIRAKMMEEKAKAKPATRSSGVRPRKPAKSSRAGARKAPG